VESEDACAAIELVQFAYFKRVLEKEKRKRRRHDSDESEAANEIEENKQAKRSKRAKRTDSDEVDPYEYDSDDEYIDQATRITRSQKASTHTESHSTETERPESSVSETTTIPQIATATITQKR